jgi:hypothetical protein
VRRKDPLHQLAISDFSKRIEDSKQVTEPYRKILELPVYPNGTTACPADNGVQYELAFFHRTQLVSTATVNALGCQSVTMNNKAFWAMEPKGKGFRTLLEHALGLNDSDFRGV